MTWPTDEEIENAGWVRISRRDRRILSTPRVRQYYWVDFPHDAYAPEFVGEHPGVVIRGGKTLHSTCIIVPVTSKPQEDGKYVHKLSRNPNPTGQDAHVICNHIYTINICRLRPIIDMNGKPSFPKIDQIDFETICKLVQLSLFPPGPNPPSENAAELQEKIPQKAPQVGAGGRPILTLKA